MTPSCIFFEGTSCTGKTTLLKKINEMDFRTKKVKCVFNELSSPLYSLKGQYEWIQKLYDVEQQIMMMEAMQEDFDVVIFDFSPISFLANYLICQKVEIRLTAQPIPIVTKSSKADCSQVFPFANSKADNTPGFTFGISKPCSQQTSDVFNESTYNYSVQKQIIDLYYDSVINPMKDVISRMFKKSFVYIFKESDYASNVERNKKSMGSNKYDYVYVQNYVFEKIASYIDKEHCKLVDLSEYIAKSSCKTTSNIPIPTRRIQPNYNIKDPPIAGAMSLILEDVCDRINLCDKCFSSLT